MRLIYLLLLGATFTITSCKKKGCTDENALNYSSEAKKDDGSCSYYTTPSTYVFKDADGNSTVSYSGQTDRLNQLEEMTIYMKSSTSAAISSSVIRDMFYNTADNGAGNFSFSSTKQLANKCFTADTAQFVSWFDSLANASISFDSTASSGQAGVLSSGSDTYLFDANGIEYTQLIEKSLMGAIFMYQATQIYFGSDKMDVDNSSAVNTADSMYYTSMEHHWDEAFGYFGVPVDFPNNTNGIRFWGKYCNSRNAELGSNTIMMNSFLIGRTAISNNDLPTRDAQITEIREMWEKVCAAQAVAYLQGAKDNFGTDNAKYLHELSEAYAFIKCLTYAPLETRIISYPQIQELLDSTIGNDFWAVTQLDLTNAISDLNIIYGF
jgi:hypothetical protein